MAPTHLILVPCHAIYVGARRPGMDGDPRDDASWVLESFQAGEAAEFVKHAEAALKLLREDEDALLVFSGGQTRRSAGPRSEAASYFAASEYLGLTSGLEDRIVTEDFARDSVENLAFGCARFFEVAGQAPERITAVGWPFKEQRFAAHAAALDLDANFSYVGAGVPADEAGALKGEKKTLEQFGSDPLGNTGGLLKKRRDRNPFSRQHPYRCPKPLVW